MGHHTEAVKLLTMSIERYSLEKRKPGAVEIVKRARNAAEANTNRKVGKEGQILLEAAMLADGAVQPWPATLVTLATGASEDFLHGTVNAYAALAKGLVWRDPFSVGAQVLTFVQMPGSNGGSAGYWNSGTVRRKLPGNRFDVKLIDGDWLQNIRQQYVLTPSTGGAGAVFREAAQLGSSIMVDALLRKGISVFESDVEGMTALHLAAQAGHADVCKLLVEAGADGLIPSMLGLTAYDLAISNRHTSVRQIFEPTASDEDVTVFSHEGSPLLEAAHEGDVTKCAEIIKQILASESIDGTELPLAEAAVGADAPAPADEVADAPAAEESPSVDQTRSPNLRLSRSSTSSDWLAPSLVRLASRKSDLGRLGLRGSRSSFDASIYEDEDPLQTLIESHSSEIREQLADLINTIADNGVTALMLAGRSGHVEALRLLCSCNADLYTPVQGKVAACSHGCRIFGARAHQKAQEARKKRRSIREDTLRGHEAVRLLLEFAAKGRRGDAKEGRRGAGHGRRRSSIRGRHVATDGAAHSEDP